MSRVSPMRKVGRWTKCWKQSLIDIVDGICHFCQIPRQVCIYVCVCVCARARARVYVYIHTERKRKKKRAKGKERIRHSFVSMGYVCSRRGNFTHFPITFVSLVRYLSKHAANFLHSLILRLWHFLIYEDGEEQLQRGKNDEDVSAHHLLQRQEADADDKVGGPIHSDGDGGSGWPGRLIEQFGHEEPWDTSRPGGKEDNEHDNEEDREVCCHLRRFLKEEHFSN